MTSGPVLSTVKQQPPAAAADEFSVGVLGAEPERAAGKVRKRRATTLGGESASSVSAGGTPHVSMRAQVQHPKLSRRKQTRLQHTPVQLQVARFLQARRIFFSPRGAFPAAAWIESPDQAGQPAACKGTGAPCSTEAPPDPSRSFLNCRQPILSPCHALSLRPGRPLLVSRACRGVPATPWALFRCHQRVSRCSFRCD